MRVAMLLHWAFRSGQSLIGLVFDLAWVPPTIVLRPHQARLLAKYRNSWGTRGDGRGAPQKSVVVFSTLTVLERSTKWIRNILAILG